jgi:4-amino-4-deoxy-L-arabinose transferase-like glycosyltransferase
VLRVALSVDRRAGELAAAVLAAAGMMFVAAAVAPHLPFGETLGTSPTDDLNRAPLVGLGLILLVLTGGIWGFARPDNRVTDGRAALMTAGAAAAVPAVTLAFVGLRASVLWLAPGSEAASLDRLLAVGAALTLPVAPVAILIALRPRVEPEVRAGLGPGPIEAVILTGIVLAFGTIVTLGMAADVPFSADESVYALGARAFLQGGPSTGWTYERPPVMAALGTIAIQLGADETAFRVFGLVFGLLAVLAAWWLARGISGRTAGLFAALAVASIPTVQVDAGLFLTDVPATALVVLLAALLWRRFEGRDPLGPGLLWLVPIAAAAFYIRYGVIIPLAALAVTVPIVWPRQFLGARQQVAVALAAAAVLLIPYLIASIGNTGVPLGIPVGSEDRAAPPYPGAALLQYLAWLPEPLVGIIAPALAVLAVVVTVQRLAHAARLRTWDRATRALTFLVLPAAIQIAVLGLFALPQERYAFPPMMLLTVAGCVAIVDVARMRAAVGRALALAVAAAVLVSFVASAADITQRAGSRSDTLAWVRQVGQEIDAHAAGTCSVLASDVAQVTWYSGCATIGYGDLSVAEEDAKLSGTDRFMVVRRDGRLQPSAAVMGRYLRRAEPRPVAAVQNASGGIVARVYRFVGSP